MNVIFLICKTLMQTAYMCSPPASERRSVTPSGRSSAHELTPSPSWAAALHGRGAPPGSPVRSPGGRLVHAATTTGFSSDMPSSPLQPVLQKEMMRKTSPAPINRYEGGRICRQLQDFSS